MPKPVIVIGGGGHAKVLIQCLALMGRTPLGILDQKVAPGVRVMGVGVLGDESLLTQHPPDRVELVNGVGSLPGHRTRAEVFSRLKARGYTFASVVHPSAVVADDVQLGEGVQIMAGAVLQPCVVVGDNSIINTHSSVDHDCRIGMDCHIAPGCTLSGMVTLGNGVHIGTGAVLVQCIQVGAYSVVGAGAVLLQNLAEKTQYLSGFVKRYQNLEISDRDGQRPNIADGHRISETST